MSDTTSTKSNETKEAESPLRRTRSSTAEVQMRSTEIQDTPIVKNGGYTFRFSRIWSLDTLSLREIPQSIHDEAIFHGKKRDVVFSWTETKAQFRMFLNDLDSFLSQRNDHMEKPITEIQRQLLEDLKIVANNMLSLSAEELKRSGLITVISAMLEGKLEDEDYYLSSFSRKLLNLVSRVEGLLSGIELPLPKPKTDTPQLNASLPSEHVRARRMSIHPADKSLDVGRSSLWEIPEFSEYATHSLSKHDIQSISSENTASHMNKAKSSPRLNTQGSSESLLSAQSNQTPNLNKGELSFSGSDLAGRIQWSEARERRRTVVRSMGRKKLNSYDSSDGLPSEGGIGSTIMGLTSPKYRRWDSLRVDIKNEDMKSSWLAALAESAQKANDHDDVTFKVPEADPLDDQDDDEFVIGGVERHESDESENVICRICEKSVPSATFNQHSSSCLMSSIYQVRIIEIDSTIKAYAQTLTEYMEKIWPRVKEVKKKKLRRATTVSAKESKERKMSSDSDNSSDSSKRENEQDTIAAPKRASLSIPTVSFEPPSPKTTRSRSLGVNVHGEEPVKLDKIDKKISPSQSADARTSPTAQSRVRRRHRTSEALLAVTARRRAAQKTLEKSTTDLNLLDEDSLQTPKRGRSVTLSDPAAGSPLLPGDAVSKSAPRIGHLRHYSSSTALMNGPVSADARRYSYLSTEDGDANTRTLLGRLHTILLELLEASVATQKSVVKCSRLLERLRDVSIDVETYPCDRDTINKRIVDYKKIVSNKLHILLAIDAAADDDVIATKARIETVPLDFGSPVSFDSSDYRDSPASDGSSPTPNPSIIPSVDDFEVIKPISKGAYATVHLARKKKTGDIFAIKVQEKELIQKKNMIEGAKVEKLLMARSSGCPYVVKLYFAFETDKYLYMVMEYLPGGDLYNLLRVFTYLPESHVVQYVAECVLALEWLHSRGIIHRDIKPDNMLIDKKGHIKLTDFGLSKDEVPWKQGLLTQTDEEIAKKVGTPDYLAPETIKGGNQSAAVDWWALGAIIFELLYGIPPFHGKTPGDVFRNILTHNYKFHNEPQISTEARDIIVSLLNKEPSKRLGANGADEVKKHKWFKSHGIDWSNLLKMDTPFVPDLDDQLDTGYFDDRGAKPIDESELAPKNTRSKSMENPNDSKMRIVSPTNAIMADNVSDDGMTDEFVMVPVSPESKRIRDQLQPSTAFRLVEDDLSESDEEEEEEEEEMHRRGHMRHQTVNGGYQSVDFGYAFTGLAGLSTMNDDVAREAERMRASRSATRSSVLSLVDSMNELQHVKRQMTAQSDDLADEKRKMTSQKTVPTRGVTSLLKQTFELKNNENNIGELLKGNTKGNTVRNRSSSVNEKKEGGFLEIPLSLPPRSRSVTKKPPASKTEKKTEIPEKGKRGKILPALKKLIGRSKDKKKERHQKSILTEISASIADKGNNSNDRPIGGSTRMKREDNHHSPMAPLSSVVRHASVAAMPSAAKLKLKLETDAVERRISERNDKEAVKKARKIDWV